MNFLQKVLLYQGGKVRYGTAGTTTTTTLASQGGLLINIDSATGDIATTAGYIEDEKYGFYLSNTANAVSGEFDSTVTRTGRLTLKASTTNVTGRWRVFAYVPARGAGLIPLKTSTKYKFGVWVKSTNCTQITWNLFSAPDQANFGTLVQRSSMNLSIGTTDWTYYTNTFTSHATDTIYAPQFRCETAGNISDFWIDVKSMTLEEVVEPVANSLTSSSPSLVSLQAVGSTDNIDQSLDPTGVAALTYIPPIAISETATNRQTFVPTKSKVTRIGVWVVNKGTGNWTLTVHDASNVVQATATIANASLTNGAFNYFNVPCNETALASYHFHVTSTVLDGTLKSGVALDCEGASYIQNYYKPTTNFKASQNNSTVSISADEDGFLDNSKINLSTGTATFTETFTYFYLLQYALSGSDLIAEINLPGVGLSASFTSDRTLNYSSDGVTYGASFPTGFSKVWVKILAYSGFASFSYSIQFSTSGISVLRNYPTNKDIIKQYSTTLGSATTSATYRATKWGFPAIEYSATEYQFLDVDTTATGSTVAFSELGTSYTVVADGASLAITSTSTPNLFVKANITANRMFISSNDYSASSDKDGSNKQSVVYSVIQ